MAYELEGTVKVIMDTQTFGSGFTKREFVVTTGDDRYPQDIKMEFVKDKTALLDKCKPGQRVKVSFDIRGGEHNGRYYVSLQAWRISAADGAGDGGGSSSAPRESAGGGAGAGGGGGGGGERGPRPDRPRPSGGGGGGSGGGGVGGGRTREWEDRRSSGRPKPEEPGERRGRRVGTDEDDIDF